jgi:hypothetical protein
MDIAEFHIYGGLVAMAVGAGLAFGYGIGLIVFGLGLIPIGVILASTQPEAVVQPGQFDGLKTAAPSDEEAA